MNTYENKPIMVTLLSDHVTINVEDIPTDPELREKFNNAIPKGMRLAPLKSKGKDFLMLYGDTETIFKFFWNVTQDFDLLLV